ncbi:hypothetical protein YC2023_008933 [Brassica napus]
MFLADGAAGKALTVGYEWKPLRKRSWVDEGKTQRRENEGNWSLLFLASTEFAKSV